LATAVLAALADVTATSGRFSSALLLADEALSQLELADASTHNPRRAHTLARTALAFTKSERLDRARDIARRIGPIDWRAWVTLKMSKSVSLAGDFSLVRGWMSEIEDSAATTNDQYARDWALACVAEGKAISGEYGDATRLALQIADPAPRSQALAGISAELYQQGEHSEALRLIREAETVAREIEDIEERVFALTSITEALTHIGDIARARRVIAEALASAPSRDALSALAVLAPEALSAVASDTLATFEPESGTHTT
jgi:tetratricopeptide (TPR) repeat protein